MATEGEYRDPVRREPSDPFADESPLAALLAPSLLAGLDAADDRTTHTAGYGLFLLARTDDELVPSLVAELAERLATDDGRRDVRRTLATLRLVDAEAVREALLSVTTHDSARRLYALVCEADPWEPPDPLPAEGDHAEYLTAFRQLIQPEDAETAEPENDQSVTDVIEDEGDGDDEDVESTTEDDESDDAERTKAGTDGSEGTETKRDRIERLTDSEQFQTLVHRSGFDDLQVVTPERERRFADVFRARARADDTERGVAVRLLHADEGTIDDGLGDVLGSWARLVEAEGVVTVVDWGTVPRPWVATECVEGRLARRGRVDPARALRAARTLSGALVELHQQDVVHAGIDPHSVVYTSTLDSGEVPMLDNVGLLGAYRQAFDPADYLDPRYAAPEYFDDQYGRIDHSTDIYQLGMVIYRLLAGRHPFDGSYDEVRAGVLGDRPPAPSKCVPRLPSAVDDVVAKATAKQKLTRYETAHRLHRDVARICDAVFE